MGHTSTVAAPAPVQQHPSGSRHVLRAATLALVGVVVLLVSVAFAITLGPADVLLVNVRDIVANHLGLADIPVRLTKDAIVWEERLPRALVADRKSVV